MDVEDIQPGENFAQAIEQVLAECSTMLVVIGPRWSELLELRAAHNEQDYVVHEIAAALRAKKTVESAFESYQQILRLDSGNKAAQDGQLAAANGW